MVKLDGSNEGSISAKQYEEKTRRLLKKLACRHLQNSRVVFFGSRANGNGNRRSDFDIACLPSRDFDPSSVAHLREEIENSNVIYGVDLVDLSRAEEAFRDKVLSEGVVWKS